MSTKEATVGTYRRYLPSQQTLRPSPRCEGVHESSSDKNCQSRDREEKQECSGKICLTLAIPSFLRLVVAGGELFGLLVTLPSESTPVARFYYSSAITHLRLQENDRRERLSLPIQGLKRYRVECKHTTTPGRKLPRIEKSVQPIGCSGLTTSGRTPAFLDHLYETLPSENVAILMVHNSRARDRGLFDRAD
jgi:hypothetical protein